MIQTDQFDRYLGLLLSRALGCARTGR